MSKFCSLLKLVLLFSLLPKLGFSAGSFNKVDGKDGSGSGPRIHWKHPQVNFELSYGSFAKALRPTIITAVVDALNEWTTVSSTAVEYNFTGCDSRGADANDGINTIVYVDTLWPVESSALAITKTYYITDPHYNTGAIIDADILVNGQHHSFGYNITTKFDMQSVITHELGHALGLGHEVTPIDTSATMYAKINAGEVNKRSLTTNDQDGIKFLYPSNINKTKRAASDKCKGDVLKFLELKDINSGGCSIGSVKNMDKDGNSKSPFDLTLLFLILIPIASLIIGRYFKITD